MLVVVVVLLLLVLPLLVLLLLVLLLLVLLLLTVLEGPTEVVMGKSHGQSQLPDWHTSSPQKLGPLPHWPSWLQQSPHLPAHCRLP